jgi:Spy/CpxP family protein refolding chaperone
MRRTLLLLALVVVASIPAFAQVSQKPYAGEEQREVKSLSPEETEALLKGEGAGMAKAAELNHYPGPKHVLELSDKLKLSESQTAAARRIFDVMRAEALRLGALVVEKERELDAIFAKGEADDERLRRVSREIGQLRADLRTAHLLAHVRVRAALTPEQIKLYDELRGYNAPGAHKHDGGRGHH